MKKNGILSMFLAVAMTLSVIPQSVSASSDTAADNPEYAYFMNTAAGSAYVWLGDKIEGDMVEFYDGQSMGITDKSDPLYNETVTIDGLVARKQYNSNSAYFKVSDKFYNKGDTEFLVSLVFYDFGPSEGKFYFEYHTTSGTVEQITLVKPGTNPGWSVKTVSIDDMDIAATYENGANFRIVNGAYNAFKKLEIANVSKAKREKTTIPTTCLGVEVKTELESLLIIKPDDTRFLNKNLGKACTGTDANKLRNIITGTTSNDSYGSKAITQGQLIEMYMNALKLTKNAGESWVEAARRYGVTDAMDYFLYDEAPATYFNLINLVHGALTYEKSNGDILLAELINNGFYEKVDAASIKSDTFQKVYYSRPRKLPYQKITNSVTGRTYMHINFFGDTLMRSYLGVQGWLPDGSGFVCGTAKGNFYLYDIKTQMLTYLDKTIEDSTRLGTFCCEDGWVYYLIIEGKKYTLARIHPRTLDKERLYELPEGLVCSYYNVTNDGRYATLETYDRAYALERPEGTYPVIRIDLQEKKLEYRWYAFTEGPNIVNHFQMNPEYPDIISFSHEYTDVGYISDRVWNAKDITDRINIMDFTTGEVKKYTSGIYENGTTIQLVTHDVWGFSGEYRYFCTWATDTTRESGAVPAVGRINKDGTHRQYFETKSGNAVHAGISGDEKMICADPNIRLISTETHQVFPIVNLSPIVGSKKHPYHPHPHMSNHGNMVSWGEIRNGVLGISFMNYTDILENEVAKGGRYPFGDCVTRISYKGLECESKITTRAGVECASAKPGTSIFLDINPEIIDVDNGAVKITFDYYDNGNNPIILTYTKGVEEINDTWKIYNRETKVKRNNTKKWKTAEVIIDCGNFENIGKFESDFKIRTTEESVYISNVKVETIEE